MKRERKDHTLQTRPDHEAYVRLVEQEMCIGNRAHFFAISAQIMRRILIDMRAARIAKRGGEHRKFSR